MVLFNPQRRGRGRRDFEINLFFFWNLHACLMSQPRFGALMNACILFEGTSEDNASAYFVWSQTFVCMKSRVIKILNVKVSFNVLFSYYVLAGGDNAPPLETVRQTSSQNLFNTLYPYWPRSSLTLETGRRIECTLMLERIYVCLQILIDSYICDQ